MTSEVAGDSGLESSWWARGLTLAERAALGPPPRPEPDERAERRLKRWRTEHDRYGAGLFEARLADVGVTEDGLLGLLGEPPAHLAARTCRPPWAAFIEAAVEAPIAPAIEGADGADPTDGPPDWVAGFAAVVAPLVDAAWQRAAGATAAADAAGQVDAAGLRHTVTERLTARLVDLAARTLVLELNVGRVTGRLTGATPAARFADFVRRTATRAGLAALLGEYAALARLAGVVCLSTVEAYLEFLDRFGRDRAAVVAELLDGVDPGRLVALDVRGDPHRAGRTVAILRFAGGAAVVYKPRPVTIHARFNELVRWLDERLPGAGLPVLPVLTRDGYGWARFIAHLPCTTEHEVARFHHRLGALMALVYAVDGVDLHLGNLIACADQPFLVDVETLLHPDLPAAGAADDPAAHALASSVDRTNLLPRLTIGDRAALDASGLGDPTGGPAPFDVVGWAGTGTDEMRLIRRPGTARGAANRPRIGDRAADPDDYLPALLAGFRAGYDAIALHRDDLSRPDGPLARCGDAEVRVVARATRVYLTLADESTHPDVMRDALDRDRALGVLWALSVGDGMRARLPRHELAELWAGDVPMFAGRPDSRDLVGVGVLPGATTGTGLDRVAAKLRRLGAEDRYNQEWVIRAAMAVRVRSDCHTAVDRVRGPGPTVPAAPLRLLTAARMVADQIVACAFDSGGRANWWGVESPDGSHWRIAPLGAGLGSGYCGVALFLAQLAAVTGESRFAGCARAALSGVGGLLARLAADPRRPAMVGCGAFAGLGGIAYGLTRTGRLLDDAELVDLGAQAVALVDAAAAGDTRAGFADGLAGGLAATVAVHQETGLPAAWDAAVRCADRLAAMLAPGGDPRSGGLDGTGFAWGTAGVGCALARFGAAGGGDRFARLGGALLDPVGPTARVAPAGPAAASAAESARPAAPAVPAAESVGWCHGRAGALLAATAHPAGTAAAGFAAALSAVVDAAPPANHSLCHGELGRLEALSAAAGRGAEVDLAGPVGAVLASIERSGVRSGTPGNVDSPGVLTGLAGVGYGLLRLACPDQVPSMLLLAPGERGNPHTVRKGTM